MSDQIYDLARKVSDDILRMPEVKNYFSLKKEIETNEELKGLYEAICECKKTKNKEKELKLQKQYNSNPLVINYNESKKEVYEILKNVSDILSSK